MGIIKPKNNTKLKYERMLEAKKKLSRFKLNYENYEKELELNKSILNELEDIKPLQNEENDLVERRISNFKLYKNCKCCK